MVDVQSKDRARRELMIRKGRWASKRLKLRDGMMETQWWDGGNDEDRQMEGEGESG